MNKQRKTVLEVLNSQDQPRYASWITHRNKRVFALYLADDLIADVLQPMVKLGLIAEVVHKSRAMYEITSAGRIALLTEEQSETPLEVVPPRERPFVPWDGRMQWDTASERGCHREIGSVGVAC